MNTPLIDCHSHSVLSGHGEGEISEYVSRARELGLAVYCQTEHLVLPEHLDPTCECSMRADDVAVYIDTLKSEREALVESGSEMELVIGIEADWLNGRADELKELCAPYEYVLGSVHFVDERIFDDPGDMSLWDELGADGVWKRYFEVWLDMARSDAPITTFSHPDLPKKFGFLPSFDTREYYEEMARAAADKGCMVEVNTAGLRKECHECYPGLELLGFFCRAGVECTVGCDAHAPQDVAAGVEEAYGLMRAAGYEYVAAPKADGSRRYFKL